MTTYAAENLLTLLSSATDPDDDPTTVYRINGSVVDWSAPPLVLPGIVTGSYNIWDDGTVRFDDGGDLSKHPDAAESFENLSLTVTALDSAGAESNAATITIDLEGRAPDGDATPPAILSMSPAAGSTGAAVAGKTAFNLSENCVFGASGTITLRNVTDGVDIETFDVTVDQGTGDGQITLTGSTLQADPTGLLPEGKVVSWRFSAGVVEDLYGNALPAIADDSLSFTTETGAPAPSSAFVFGRLTPAGQAGFAASSFTPDASGYFELVGGKVVVSAAGEAAGLPASSYAVTIDGNPETIDVVANAISTADYSEVSAAVATLEALANIDGQVIIRNGSEIASNGVFNTLGSGGQNGAFAHPYITGYAHNIVYSDVQVDDTSRATVTGGSVTIRPDTPLGAVWRKQINTHSASKIVFQGMLFEKVATAICRNMCENGSVPVPSGANTGDSSDKIFLIRAGHQQGASLPTGIFIVQDCEVGGHRWGTPCVRWSSYFEAYGMGHFAIEDNLFEGYMHGVVSAKSRCAIFARNISRKKAIDFHRTFGTKAANNGGDNYVLRHNNLDYDVLGHDPSYPEWFARIADHSDHWQSGTPGDECNTNFIDCHNIFYGDKFRGDPTPYIHALYDGTNGYPDFTGTDFSSFRRPSAQGNWAANGGSGFGALGTSWKNFLMSNGFNGLVCSPGDSRSAINCTCVHGAGLHDDNRGGNNNAVYDVVINGNPINPEVIQNCIWTKIKGNTGAANYTITNNTDLEVQSLGLAASYDTNFAGNDGSGGGFTLGSWGIAYPVDTSSPAAFKASIRTAFAARGPSAGRGAF